MRRTPQNKKHRERNKKHKKADTFSPTEEKADNKHIPRKTSKKEDKAEKQKGKRERTRRNERTRKITAH